MCMLHVNMLQGFVSFLSLSLSFFFSPMESFATSWFIHYGPGRYRTLARLRLGGTFFLWRFR